MEGTKRRKGILSHRGDEDSHLEGYKNERGEMIEKEKRGLSHGREQLSK
jgi:hypothetical protein